MVSSRMLLGWRKGIYGNQTPNYVNCFKGILTATSTRVPYKCRREFLQFCSFWLRLLEQHICRCYIWGCVVPYYTFVSFVMKTSSTLFSNCVHACHEMHHSINDLPVLEVPKRGICYSNTDKLLQQDLNFILKLGLCLHSFKSSLLEKVKLKINKCEITHLLHISDFYIMSSTSGHLMKLYSH